MSQNSALITLQTLAEMGLASLTRLGEINLSLLDRLTAKQLAAMDLLIEHGNDTLAHAVTAKDPLTFIKNQTEAVHDLSRVIMAESRTNLAMATHARDEFQLWFKQNLAQGTDELTRLVPVR